MTEERTRVMPNGERVSLRDYVDVRFEAISQQRQATEKTLDARLESMNEFRQAITDQSRTFMTKEEYRLAHSPLAEDAQEFRDFMSKHQGKASQNQVLAAYALAVVSMILGIVMHFMK